MIPPPEPTRQVVRRPTYESVRRHLADRRTFRLGILRDPNGSGGSLHVHDQLQDCDTVRIRGPRNNLPLVDSPRYLFIAGGIGITPILAMIRSADAAGADWRLVYGGR